eukprot:5046980-Pyramimonas_sp.AAC.1
MSAGGCPQRPDPERRGPAAGAAAPPDCPDSAALLPRGPPPCRSRGCASPTDDPIQELDADDPVGAEELLRAASPARA